MDAGDKIALVAVVVAVLAAVVAFWQARTADRAAKAAAEQVAAAKNQVHEAKEANQLMRQQLDQAERALREQNEPYVIVDIQPQGPGSTVLVVAIENIGPTVARNVRIACDPPLVSGWGQDLTELLQRALSHTHPMLPPGRRLEFLFDKDDRFQSDLPTAYDFTVHADGPYGPMEPLQYIVDFSTWADALRTERPTYKIEEKLGAIGEHLKDLTAVYKTANGSALRDEQAHRREQLRQHAQRRSDTRNGTTD